MLSYGYPGCPLEGSVFEGGGVLGQPYLGKAIGAVLNDFRQVYQ